MFKQHMLATTSYTVIMSVLPRMDVAQVARVLAIAARQLGIGTGMPA